VRVWPSRNGGFECIGGCRRGGGGDCIVGAWLEGCCWQPDALRLHPVGLVGP
jgi:hypothetical protein